MSLMRRHLGSWLVGALLLASGARAAEPYPLTLAQRDHLRNFIPRTFAKLDGQRPVHIVALGDSVSWMYVQNGNSGNWLLSYLGHFGNRLAREFFYTGGVRALNPESEHPAKIREHLGREILIENLAIGGRCALDAVQRVTTDAFVNQPDLVVINFGINDSNRGYSLDSYRRALQSSIDACRQNRADVIVLGPSLTRASPGPTGWGLPRMQATVAREVAEKNGVLFVDLGAGLAPLGGGIPAGVEPEAAVLTMADRLGRIFELDPMPEVPDTLHPNESAHEVMGRVLFERLIGEEPASAAYSLNGRGELVENGRVKVRLSLRNQSAEARKGYVGALAMGHLLTPEKPYHAFDLKPGQNLQLEIDYLRTPSQHTPGGHAAFDIADANLRLSYFVVDESGSNLLDVVTRVEPVAVEWISQVFRKVSDGVRFEWQFVNGLAQATRGRYRIGMGEAVSGWVAFDLDPLGSKRFQASFPFKPVEGAARFKTPVFIDVEVGGKTFSFPRELEAVRDLSLGQRVALSQGSAYADPTREPLAGPEALPEGETGVLMRADADANFLFLTFDFVGLPFSDRPEAPALIADISLDARPAAEVGQFGFVDKLRINAGAADDSATVDRPQLGAFGDGYNMILPADGFRTVFKARTADSRRLEVHIPRRYLFRHEWQVGSPESVLGIGVSLSLSQAGANGAAAYPDDRRFVHTLPHAGIDRTLYHRDARGLGQLRLSTAPVATWSAHLY